MFLRKNVIESARSWIGTRFRYQGRVKKNNLNAGGVDCLGLVFGVCDEVGYEYDGKPLSHYDNVIYSKRPDFSLLIARFNRYFFVKTVDKIGVGDIVLKKLSEQQYHLMFYTGNTFIHASAKSFSVVEHGLDGLDNCMVYSMFED